MIFLKPEYGIGDEKVLYLVPAIIKYQRTPFLMFSYPRIKVLVKSSTIKPCQAVCILGEMPRHPVEYHTYPILLEMIHKVHKVFRASVTAFWGKQSHNPIHPST